MEKERDGYRASSEKLRSHVEEARAERKRLEEELERRMRRTRTKEKIRCRS